MKKTRSKKSRDTVPLTALSDRIVSFSKFFNNFFLNVYSKHLFGNGLCC
jgi:hypothetical protein